MQLLLANHSSYPSAGVGREAIRESVGAQESAGLDLLTDGQPTWADPFSHLPARLAGVRLAGTSCFPGTEQAYRQPIVEARLRRRGPLVVDDFRRAREATTFEVKPVLTGPCTLARLSQVATTAYPTASSLSVDYSTLLAQEVHDLVAAGARTIQIDEPILLHHPEDVRPLRDLLEPLQTEAGDAAALAVVTYWGLAAALYAQLNSLAGDLLGIDLCSDTEVAETIAATGSGKVLLLGIVDGRAPRVEQVDSLARVVDRVLSRYVHDRIYLQPSCGMAGLPRDIARAKLGVLSSVRRRVLGEDAG